MEKSSIKKNIVYQSLYEVLILILPFITSPYIARILGAEKLGVFSYTHAIANYFVIFAMLGIKNHGNREIAKVRDNEQELSKTFSNLLFLHIITSSISIFLYAIYFVCFVKEYSIHFFLQSFFVVSALFDISWFYFGIEKFKLTVTRNSILKIISVILVFLLVKNTDDLWKYTAIMSLGTLMSQIILWLPLKKYVKLQKPSLKEMKKNIAPIITLFIPVIAISLYKYMDKIMIGSISTKKELGFYENSEKVLNISLTIITSFGTVMLPRMSNLLNKNKEAAKKYIQISMKYIMMIAIAISCGLFSVATIFSIIFWGKRFERCGIIIKVLAISIPFTAFANIIRTQYLIPTKKDRNYISSVFTGAIVNLILNVILIPKYGAIGASIGTLFAEIAVCIMQTLAVIKELTIKKYILSFISFIPVGLIMVFALYLINYYSNPTIINLIIQVMVGGIIYITLAILILLFSNDQTFTNFISGIRKRSQGKT